MQPFVCHDFARFFFCRYLTHRLVCDHPLFLQLSIHLSYSNHEHCKSSKTLSHAFSPLTCSIGQICRVRFSNQSPIRITPLLTPTALIATAGAFSSSQAAAHTTLPRRASTRIVPSAQRQTTRDACRCANSRTAIPFPHRSKTATQTRAKKLPKTCHPPLVMLLRAEPIVPSRALHRTGARRVIVSVDPFLLHQSLVLL